MSSALKYYYQAMKVLMTKDVKGVAQRGTVKEVSDGYAMNFLIANGLAVQATPDKLAAYEAQQKVLQATHAEKEKESKQLAARMADMRIEVPARSNASGHLYKQLSADLVVDALKKHGITIAKESVMFEAPIKETGERTISLKLGTQTAKLNLTVVAEA